MSLFKNGIYLLRNLPSANLFYQSLTEASKHVQNNLYIDFLTKEFQEENFQTSHHTFQELISLVYNRPRDLCSTLDIHVLLPPVSHYKCLPRKTQNPLDGCILPESLKCESISGGISSLYEFRDFSVKYINIPDENDLDSKRSRRTPQIDVKLYDGVVIGGTFDRIHDGHRLLVTKALLHANKKFTCGVAQGPLLERKILTEFIEPVGVRIDNVVKMVEDYKPGLQHKIVPLEDMCGPSGTDDDLQLLIVSEETRKGGDVVNETRRSNNLQSLDVISINMVEDSPVDLSESLNNEGKVSSSAYRVRLLGTLRKPPNYPMRDNCYLIGLAGGIATGKSSVAKRFEKLGAYVIDCDKLGHEAYLPGRDAYHKIIEHFGEKVRGEDGNIDRRKLGPIVFGDKEELKTLNSIVWPEIRCMILDIVDKVKKEGLHDVIIYEAAIIFESGWDKDANEVWSCVVPPSECIKRIQERNGLSEEAARSRISAQMSNQERVDRSHVVLSTLWEPEFTQTQCEKAWRLLKQRISAEGSSASVPSKI